MSPHNNCTASLSVSWMWCIFMFKNLTDKKCINLIDCLAEQHSLSPDEYRYILDHVNDEIAEYTRQKAVYFQKQIYGNDVYIRGLIEISNYCKNDCYYCGIRNGNSSCTRYRLTKEQILSCCKNGYELGFRTFVLQGGEDAYFSDEIVCDIVRSIKVLYPDCAVTLSLGERSRDSYKALFNAGADRYLLRHETANKDHYEKLHPDYQSFDRRMDCLTDLKMIGYQVGCGFMVGSPFQTNEHIAKDLKFIEEFKPDMCGIGPFIPHSATPFADYKQGSLKTTLYLISIIRLIHPRILLPATTALGTISPDGREKGILAGANVIMPNLSPVTERKKYELYNNKLCTDDEASENVEQLKKRIAEIGYNIVTSRGDVKDI